MKLETPEGRWLLFCIIVGLTVVVPSVIFTVKDSLRILKDRKNEAANKKRNG